uniref:DUF2281 domain-containing protein n=1 Tax=Candidatus Kentrum sp. TUN TaxID=2126343 RepID=A0A451A440_9GAMM|nr:MAG: Protein of unknown function (DUF2281) [Candidatus Kentron sp. TUN]VFK63687.1 MAG: Protein of unknown function (DUF2281) [Candidatus Kentron sp. TUN]VFK70079.1 MAG: Protein of unknown function (DUF2281) [Candidatus Kentron sp. TUN]
MNTNDAKRLTDQVAQLPPEKQTEVLDFVQFLLEKEQQQLSQATSQLSEPSLATVWDNADDAAYDQL